MHTLVYRGAVALVSVAALIIAPAAAAAAETSAGIDVSYPQCGTAAPSDYSFVIVGINGGKANNDNPCRNTQLGLVSGQNGSTIKPARSVYVNTGNPELAGAWWPSSNTTQYAGAIHNPLGSCKHTATAACSYIYGYSMASDDLTDARTMSPSPIANPTSYFWWLDVETSNTWSATTSRNVAALRGMVDYFATQGIETGVYSTATQWKQIVGTVTSTSALAGLPTWLAGSTASGAPAACAKTGLTTGSVITLVQYVSSRQDYDYFCKPMSAGFPSISGTAASGKTLTGTNGTWQKGATLTNRWYRNGVAISGATARTYKLTSSDVGKSITMTTTGTQSGYQKTTNSSSAIFVNHTFSSTPAPKVTGTPAVGHTLKATVKSWSPAASFSRQWKRNGVAISGETGSSYTLTSADLGKSITFTLTGSKVGYNTVSRTTAAHLVRAG